MVRGLFDCARTQAGFFRINELAAQWNTSRYYVEQVAKHLGEQPNSDWLFSPEQIARMKASFDELKETQKRLKAAKLANKGAK